MATFSCVATVVAGTILQHVFKGVAVLDSALIKYLGRSSVIVALLSRNDQLGGGPVVTSEAWAGRPTQLVPSLARTLGKPHWLLGLV